jgi:hypothetical protein
MRLNRLLCQGAAFAALILHGAHITGVGGTKAESTSTCRFGILGQGSELNIGMSK